MPIRTQSQALEAVEKTRAQFSHAVRSYRAQYGLYIDTAPSIPQEKIEGCRMFADRLSMLNSSLFPAGLVWAEVGVDKGDFSREILARTKPFKLHLIDLEPDRLEPENVAKALEQRVVEMHAGDSAVQLATFPDAYFDVIYIDGDHYYEGVKRDIAAAKSKIRPRGLLVFNDYAAWSPGYMYRCGVAKAVNEFINSNTCSVVAFAIQGSGYHDIAIRVD
jgi:predicted O-methyltransferase YrrM